MQVSVSLICGEVHAVLHCTREDGKLAKDVDVDDHENALSQKEKVQWMSLRMIQSIGCICR
jgi:hypothetical protein